jgi:hypothetical protein
VSSASRRCDRSALVTRAAAVHQRRARLVGRSCPDTIPGETPISVVDSRARVTREARARRLVSRLTRREPQHALDIDHTRLPTTLQPARSAVDVSVEKCFERENTESLFD